MLLRRVFARGLAPLAAALLPVLGAAAETVPVTYLAPGVDAENITASTRFYDVGKGAYYWNSHLTETEKLYNLTKDFSFMGELKKYVQQTHFSQEAFQNLIGDQFTCWYNAGSNAIQYWQDCYAPFYRREDQSGALPQGLTYNRDNLEVLAGTQSLQVNMAFYDEWPDMGGPATDAFQWYLGGSKDEPNGGYFKEYYNGVDTGKECGLYDTQGVVNMEKVTAGILESFGLERMGDGSLASVEEGLIPTLSASNNAAAHALTCYGFTLAADGTVDSLYIADSDDAQYRIEHVYLKVEESGGYERLLMFEDEECTKGWHSEGLLKWGITGIYHINTPDRLKTLYTRYHAPETPLEWTGESSLWATGTTLGWNVNIEGETYGSGYENGRITRFTDKAESVDITVQGELEAAGMEVANENRDYTFKRGEEAASLKLGTLDKSGACALHFHGFAIAADTLYLRQGTISLNDGASLEIGGKLRVEGGSISGAADTEYSTESAAHAISNATATILGKDATTLSNALANVRLVNSGGGALAVAGEITGSFSVEAQNGGISILNRSAGLTVQDMALAAGQTIGVYRAGVIAEEEETALIVKGALTAGAGAKLVADLTLGTGATLDVSGTGAMGLALGSALTLTPGMFLSQKDMELVANMSARDTYGLFSGVDELTLEGTDIFGATAPLQVDAAGWFTGFQPMQYNICYDGSNVGLVRLVIPEPASGALALPALAALAARRRRR